ncbi:MAG: cysteine hydrolase family protein [Pseudomonadota bacterium]
MTMPKTLLELAGADLTPVKMRDACLILIDMQNEYLDGPIAVAGAQEAVAEAAKLLQAAREGEAPIFHIAHKGKAGSLFDRDAVRGQIIEAVAPQPGEGIVEKQLPNAFAATELGDMVAKTARTNIVLCGFMTHMCVSSTARAALDLGYRTTIVEAACGTRDLPDRDGGVIPAATIHSVAMTELSDRFAVIARDASALM